MPRGSTRPVVGMVGGGQLARMTYQAAIALDVELRVFATSAGDAGAAVARHATIGKAQDLAALEAFAGAADLLTFDHEVIPPEHLERLAATGHVLRPAPGTKRFAQDKAHQRRALGDAGIPVPAHAPVATSGDVSAFAAEHGWPVVVKTTRGGYDGRGVWVVEGAHELSRLAEEAGPADLLVEELVSIERELAVLVARRPGGEARVYPLVETVQVGGICHELQAPAGVPAELAEAAGAMGTRIAEEIDLQGIMAVELFESEGALLVNELACRPHNSGHWTIEGAMTSQFENHLRAVLDWPLGDTSMSAGAAVTVNLLGPRDGSDPRSALAGAPAVDGVRVHLYGKEARPGRKLGHVTALGDDLDEAHGRAWQAARGLVGEEGTRR